MAGRFVERNVQGEPRRAGGVTACRPVRLWSMLVVVVLVATAFVAIGPGHARADIVNCDAPSAASVCRDGTCSTTTGSGTCSYHGGVSGPVTRQPAQAPPPPSPCAFGSVRLPNGACVSEGALRFEQARQACPFPNTLLPNLACLSPDALAWASARATCPAPRVLLPNQVCVTLAEVRPVPTTTTTVVRQGSKTGTSRGSKGKRKR